MLRDVVGATFAARSMATSSCRATALDDREPFAFARQLHFAEKGESVVRASRIDDIARS